MRTRAPENAPPPGAPPLQLMTAQREQQAADETTDQVRERLGGTADYLQRLFGSRNALSGGSLRAPIAGR